MKKLGINKLTYILMALVIILFFKNFKNHLINNINNHISKNIVLSTPTGGNFSIPSTNGDFNLKDQKGFITFIFFGFTKCPDICPETLRNIQQMYKKLTLEEKQKLKVLFISVDNERDTIETLKLYLKSFDSNFIGATTTDEDLNKILKLYGARFTKIKNEVTKDLYIDHTSQVFIINSRNEWADTLKHNSSTEEFLEAFNTADNKNLSLAVEKKSRTIPVITENNECYLNKGPCEIKTFDQKVIRVSITPQPIEIEKDLKILVSTDSKDYEPLEVDFEGVELNMGLIRPKLKLNTIDGTYSGDFYLPLCEIDEMNWIARLIVKTPNGDLGAFNFRFKTFP